MLYNGSILAGQKTGNDTLVFMYDNNGNYFGFTYNGEAYYYVKNAQNDVVAILDSNKAVVAKYQYDAWGNCTVRITGGLQSNFNNYLIARANPIRYRSYYFDSETGFYYLKSRYYSPEMCRFLNADGYASTDQGLLGSKMFAYCLNNPVNFHDPSGSYSVSFLAEGEGDMIITPEAGDPDIITSHIGNTYTVEVQPGTGGGSAAGAISAINGAVVSELSGNFIEKFIERLGYTQYQNYVKITFSNASGAILKNIGVTCHNTIYTALSPYLNDMKVVGNGVVSMAAYAVDCYMDLHKYGGSQSDLNKAIAITTLCTSITVGVALLCTGIGASAGATLIITTFTGVWASLCADVWKKDWIGY